MQERLKIAVIAAEVAGKLVLSMWSNELNGEFKIDNSPVTAADKASERLIKQLILDKFPKDGFFGEETGRQIGSSGYFWACDPIDGTWSYLNHEDTCTVCLSLHKEEKTYLSVIYNPFTDVLYQGAIGISPTRNGELMPLVRKTKLEDGVVNFFISSNRVEDVARLYELRRRGTISKLVTQGGSIAHSMAQLACGINNAFVGIANKPSNIWDLAGGIFLIREAGGMVTNLKGDAVDGVNAKEALIASSHPAIHQEILEALNEMEFGKER